jgi:hypothetical protein
VVGCGAGVLDALAALRALDAEIDTGIADEDDADPALSTEPHNTDVPPVREAA